MIKWSDPREATLSLPAKQALGTVDCELFVHEVIITDQSLERIGMTEGPSSA